jgi:hypothetical protein
MLDVVVAVVQLDSYISNSRCALIQWDVMFAVGLQLRCLVRSTFYMTSHFMQLDVQTRLAEVVS